MAVTVIDKIVSAVNRVGKRTYDQRRENRQSANQRRNTFVDIYGLDIQGQGDTGHPASFGISISPDLIYFERWEFKIAIRSFAIPVSSGKVDATSIGVEVPSANTGNAVPNNPHNHAINARNATVTPNPHSHSLTPGIAFVQSTISDFEVWIEGVNITSALKAQHPGEWPSGEGVFPSGDLDKFDILKAIEHLHDWQKGVILTAGYKKVEFRAKGVFNGSFVNYLKYSAVNR